MKFTCKRFTNWQEEKAHYSNWHPIFAFLPHNIKDTKECRWLETIQRRGLYSPWVGWVWEYKV